MRVLYAYGLKFLIVDVVNGVNVDVSLIRVFNFYHGMATFSRIVAEGIQVT